MSRVLRERREEIGREIKEIAQITRIKGSYLKFIENEDYEKLPVEVYTKGYIREYAEFLDIPYNVAVSPYERYLESKTKTKGKEQQIDKTPVSAQPPEVTDELEQNIKKAALRERDDSKRASEGNTFKNFLYNRNIWIIPFIIIIAGVLLVALQQKRLPPSTQKPEQPVSVTAAPPAPVQQDKMEESASKPPADAKVADAVKPKARTEDAVRPETSVSVKGLLAVANEKPREKDSAQKENTVQKKKHNLNIAATDESWVQVTIDGSEIKSMLLKPGERVNYGANKSFTLKVGNAAGVVLNYDGKELKNLGVEREVVTLNFPSLPAQQPADVNNSSEPSNQ